MDGSNVGATDRLSMLKPRPLNNPAIRDRTPNLFSTVTKMMCSIVLVSSSSMTLRISAPAQNPLCRQDRVFVLWSHLGAAALFQFQLRRIVQNHLVIAPACRNHGIDVFVGMCRHIHDD